LVGIVRGCSATPYIDADPVGDGWVKVGEAAIGVDPLSSQGVQVAMTGGLQGAAVAHTILTDPGHTTAAWRFYRERLWEIGRRHAAAAAAHYREHALVCPRSFWQDRAGPIEPVTLPPTADLSRPMPDPGSTLRLSEQAELVEVPILRDDLIRFDLAVRVTSQSRPVAFLAGIPLRSLLPDLDGTRTTREILDRWGAKFGVDRGIEAFTWGWRHGLMSLNREG
jgi:hypothetical protein